MSSKVKSLQMWCKQQCQGYKDVEITNMTTSWKSGLAFCAIIHRYYPNLIDYNSLNKENIYENNILAFQIGHQLGISPYLDAEDMVKMKVPDKLSIITYVSQYYNLFATLRPSNSKYIEEKSEKNARTISTLKRQATDIPNISDDSNKITYNCSKNPSENSFVSKKQLLDDLCNKCNKKVYLMERYFFNNKLYHRSCYRNSENIIDDHSNFKIINKERKNLSDEKTSGDDLAINNILNENKNEVTQIEQKHLNNNTSSGADFTINKIPRKNKKSINSPIIMKKEDTPEFLVTESKYHEILHEGDVKKLEFLENLPKSDDKTLESENGIKIINVKNSGDKDIINSKINKLEELDFSNKQKKSNNLQDEFSNDLSNKIVIGMKSYDNSLEENLNVDFNLKDEEDISSNSKSFNSILIKNIENSEILITHNILPEKNVETCKNINLNVNDILLLKENHEETFNDKNLTDNEKSQSFKMFTLSNAKITSSIETRNYLTNSNIESDESLTNSKSDNCKSPSIKNSQIVPAPIAKPRIKLDNSVDKNKITTNSSFSKHNYISTMNILSLDPNSAKNIPLRPPPPKPARTFILEQQDLGNNKDKLALTLIKHTEIKSNEKDGLKYPQNTFSNIQQTKSLISTQNSIIQSSPLPKPRINISGKNKLLESITKTNELESNFDKNYHQKTPPPRPLNPPIKSRTFSSSNNYNIKCLANGIPSTKTIIKRKVMAEERTDMGFLCHKLATIDHELKELEKEGRILEDRIRSGSEDLMDDDVDLMISWFDMINFRNELIREESTLIYKCKQQELEDMHSDLEHQLRFQMAIPDSEKTETDRQFEDKLLAKLIEIVAQRNIIVDSIEIDRVRYIKEDEELNKTKRTSTMLNHKKSMSKKFDEDVALQF